MENNFETWKTKWREARYEKYGRFYKSHYSGVTDKYKLIVVVQTIKEAKQLIEGCPQIKSLNLGNTKESKTTTQVSKQVFLEEKRKKFFAS